MPYIPLPRREELQRGEIPQDSGELNYLITRLFIVYWNNHKTRYQVINDISGASNEALAEFRRRVTGNYEDKKILENGDVYDSLITHVE